MKTPFKSVGLLLPLILAGCMHKTQTAQTQTLAPPIAETPLPTPPPAPTSLPAPATATAPVQAQPTAPPTEKAEEKPVRHTTHHPKQEKNTEEAANTPAPTPGAPAEVSAIGQLSTGGSSDLRSETENSLASTERGLKSINRSLNDQEQKTASQIREFLKQAHTALTTGDVDGAHTLAVKAQVLLAELNQ